MAESDPAASVCTMVQSELAPDDVRRIAIRAQRLDRRRAGGPGAVLTGLGAVQLDTISVLARSHELVAYARIGAVGRQQVESAYWGRGRTFEYWSHAACILPIERYPDFAFRMRASQPNAERWGASAGAIDTVRRSLAAHGPQTATELGGARRSSGWWNWSDAKSAVEWLLATGEVVVSERRSWKRVYDLAERVIDVPAQAHWVEDRGVVGPSDERCVRDLLLASVQTLGVGTLSDVQDVHRLRGAAGPESARSVRAELQSLVDAGEVREVRVAGWAAPAYADPSALRRIPRTDASLTTLLSPFDSLVWHRDRLERIFGLRHRIEAYTPRDQRKYGYFAMPVLHAGRIVGLVDPARDGHSLLARRITMFGPDAEAAVATALAEAAKWVGAREVRVEAAPTAGAAKRIAVAATRAVSGA